MALAVLKCIKVTTITDLADGNGEVWIGESMGEAMGLSVEPAWVEDTSMRSISVLDAMVKSLVTLHMLQGTTGVPRDCWLQQVASL